MQSNKKGYVVLEALLSIVVLSIVVIAIFPMLNFLMKRSERSKYEAQASLLLQEGAEVAYNVLIDDWGAYFPDTYFPALDSSIDEWVLQRGEEEDIETLYDRSIVISNVCRDPSNSGEIVSCPGVVDNKSKMVITTVSWEEGGINKEIVGELLLINLNEK